MGYFSKFYIALEKDGHDFPWRDMPKEHMWEVRSLLPYAGDLDEHCGFDTDQELLTVAPRINDGDGIKWYGWVETMLALSKALPGYTFHVARRGEDPFDNEIGNFTNGCRLDLDSPT